MCIEDGYTFKNDIILYCLYFDGSFLSADHTQLIRVLRYLRLPKNFITIVSNLYRGATASFLTSHNPTAQIQVLRGTIQGDPLSPLLFDLTVEPLIR
jgi:hypothetical protein